MNRTLKIFAASLVAAGLLLTGGCVHHPHRDYYRDYQRHHDRYYYHHDRDNNPPGRAGGPGTNWENPPGPWGGPGASPDRRYRW